MTDNRPMTRKREAAVFLLLSILALIPTSASAAHPRQDEDLARPVEDKDNELQIRPPRGWLAKEIRGIICRLHPAESRGPVPSLDLNRVFMKNPTTLATFSAALRAWVKKRFPKGEVAWEKKELQIGGHPAFQLAIKWKDGDQDLFTVKTAVLRTYYEFYTMDAVMAAGDDKTLKIIDKSVSTFTFEPNPLEGEDLKAEKKGEAFLLAESAVRQEIVSDNWLGIYFSKQRIGYQHFKVSPDKVAGRQGYRFEAEISYEPKNRDENGKEVSGGKDETRVTGFASSDFSYQRLESIETVQTAEGPVLRFDANATIDGGKLVVKRHIDGLDETKTLDVGKGALLTDVADLVRRAIVCESKGGYLFHTIDPFSDEVGWERMDYEGQESVKTGPKEEVEVAIVLHKTNRGHRLVYKYAVKDKRLFIMQGEKNPFVSMACSKEEATGEKK